MASAACVVTKKSNELSELEPLGHNLKFNYSLFKLFHVAHKDRFLEMA